MEYLGLAHALALRLVLAVAGGSVLCLSYAQAGGCAESVYSPVSEEACSPVPALEVDRRIVSGRGEYVFACPGAPEGYRLYLIESDPRSWYVVEYGGTRHSLEQMIVYNNPPGDFPNVGQGGKVEWVLVDGMIKGVIFRVSYQSSDAASRFSRLFSVDLQGNAPVLKGVSPGNEEARQWLNDCADD